MAYTKPLNAKLSMFYIFTTSALLVFIFTSCSPQVIITTDKKGQTDAYFSTTLSKTAEKLVRRFTGTEEGLLFDNEKISLSLSLAGLSSHQIEFSSPTSLYLSAIIPKTQNLLSKAIQYSQTSNTLTVAFTPDSVQSAIQVMPYETADFLELLMAPVLTGEKLTEAEYKEIIGATYGKTILKELEDSIFSLTLRCPAKITSIVKPKSGTVDITNNTAVFTIPLIGLLVMEQQISATVKWD